MGLVAWNAKQKVLNFRLQVAWASRTMDTRDHLESEIHETSRRRAKTFCEVEVCPTRGRVCIQFMAIQESGVALQRCSGRMADSL